MKLSVASQCWKPFGLARCNPRNPDSPVSGTGAERSNTQTIWHIFSTIIVGRSFQLFTRTDFFGELHSLKGTLRNHHRPSNPLPGFNWFSRDICSFECYKLTTSTFVHRIPAALQPAEAQFYTGSLVIVLEAWRAKFTIR